MNASHLLKSIMSQATGGTSQGGGSFDFEGVLGGLASQLGAGKSQSSGTAGLDMKSLLGGGALGMLIGSKRGRKMGGKALKYGAIAGAGVLAWKAWQNYQSSVQSSSLGSAMRDHEQGKPMQDLKDRSDQEQRGLEILQAMIMAARADGHIDEAEQAHLVQEIDAMGADQELHDWVQQQLQSPLDAQQLASQADSPQAAREIYLVSVAMVDDQNPMERAWLDQLSAELEFDRQLTAELERQVHQAG